jgi:hypothetical protein
MRCAANGSHLTCTPWASPAVVVRETGCGRLAMPTIATKSRSGTLTGSARHGRTPPEGENFYEKHAYF